MYMEDLRDAGLDYSRFQDCILTKGAIRIDDVSPRRPSVHLSSQVLPANSQCEENLGTSAVCAMHA